MAITLTDPALIAELKAAGDHVEFSDASGEVIARLTRASLIELTAPCKTPEQLAAARAKGPGRTSVEIIADARARAACSK